MNRKSAVLIPVVVLLLIVTPVAIRQIVPHESRHLEGVALSETVYEEVRFRNDRQGINLAGMFFVPPGDVAFPATVIIHGSGTSSRDNRWYLTLARHLHENGIAVLLPDKRGSEQSHGNWRTSDFHDLATDTVAAIEFLSSLDNVDESRLGIIGMSQGGWIAPIVADLSSDVAFVVSMVGSAVTPKEQLSFEENHNLRQMGFLPGISNAIAFLSTAYIRNIGQKEFWDAIGNYDPMPHWSRLNVDALVLFGTEDTNVPSASSAARFREIDKPNIEVKMYDGSGHALEDPVASGNRLIRRDVLDEITRFILADAGTSRR